MYAAAVSRRRIHRATLYDTPAGDAVSLDLSSALLLTNDCSLPGFGRPTRRVRSFGWRLRIQVTRPRGSRAWPSFAKSRSPWGATPPILVCIFATFLRSATMWERIPSRVSSLSPILLSSQLQLWFVHHLQLGCPIVLRLVLSLSFALQLKVPSAPILSPPRIPLMMT